MKMKMKKTNFYKNMSNLKHTHMRYTHSIHQIYNTQTKNYKKTLKLKEKKKNAYIENIALSI